MINTIFSFYQVDFNQFFAEYHFKLKLFRFHLYGHRVQKFFSL